MQFNIGISTTSADAGVIFYAKNVEKSRKICKANLIEFIEKNVDL